MILPTILAVVGTALLTGAAYGLTLSYRNPTAPEGGVVNAKLAEPQ